MLAGRMVASVVQRQVRYVTPVPPTAATGLVRAVYRQVADESRLVIPPALSHSPAPRVLAAYWMLTRESVIATGAVDRLAKEAMAAAVAVATICPYCVDMHTTGMYDLSTPHDAEAIVRDRLEDIEDLRVRTLARWARAAHTPDDPDSHLPRLPGDNRAELVGVVVAMHYLTRMVNVFLSNFLLPPGLGPGARRRFKQGVSRVLAPTLRAYRQPGRSLSLLPDAAPAAGVPGAGDVGPVVDAVRRSFAIFEHAGRVRVSPLVRALVNRRLAVWRGEETGLSRDWCEELIRELPETDRATGRLALLTALASYQVDSDVVAEFRRYHPEDVALVETAAWASYAAARRVGQWHQPSIYWEESHAERAGLIT